MIELKIALMVTLLGALLLAVRLATPSARSPGN
jgi:hypothetical protein